MNDIKTVTFEGFKAEDVELVAAQFDEVFRSEVREILQDYIGAECIEIDFKSGPNGGGISATVLEDGFPIEGCSLPVPRQL